MYPTVVKRDGQTEKFSLINLARVVQATGLSPEQTKQVVEKVSDWAKNLGKETVTSLEIRDELITQLENADKSAAGLFRWYEESKQNPLASSNAM